MKVHSLKDKSFVKYSRPEFIEFECSNCGKLVKISRQTFLSRKHLKCISCANLGVKHPQKINQNKKKRNSDERKKIIIERLKKKGLEVFETIMIDGETTYKFRCNKCGEVDSWRELDFQIGRNPYCKRCFNNGRSREEDELYEFIRSIYKGKIIRNSRNIIKPKELDFFFPELKIAIEYNGTYWHTNDSHILLEKILLCNKMGIMLFHFFDDDWKNNKNQMKTKILLSLQKNQAFLEENHNKVEAFIRNSPKTQFLNEPKKKIQSLDEIKSLHKRERVLFNCIKCGKEKNVTVETLSRKTELICGNCMQAEKMSKYQQTIKSGFMSQTFIYPKNRKSKKRPLFKGPHTSQ